MIVLLAIRSTASRFLLNVEKLLKTIAYRQLAAIAREILDDDPTIDDAEWKARILDRLPRLQLRLDDRDMLGRVLSAVEVAARRPAPTVPARGRVEPHDARPLTRDEAAALVAKYHATPRPIAPAHVRDVARQRALQIIAHAIVEQVARCEAAEKDKP